LFVCVCSGGNIQSPTLTRRTSNGTKDRFSSSHHNFFSQSCNKRNAKKKKKKRVLFEDDRRPYVVELDEETDLDMLAVLSDRAAPAHLEFVNTQVVPGSSLPDELLEGCGGGDEAQGILWAEKGSVQVKEIKVMRRVKIDNGTASRGGINPLINQIFQEAYARLCFPLRTKSPCEVLGLAHRITVLDDTTIEIFFTAMSHYRDTTHTDSMTHSASTHSLSSSMNQLSLALSSSAAARPALRPLIPLEAFAFQKLLRHKASNMPTASSGQQVSLALNNTMPSVDSTTSDTAACHDPLKTITVENQAVANVTLSSLNYIPGRRILRYLGPLQLHFIKESWGMSGKSLLGTFFYIFQSEVDAAARAQVILYFAATATATATATASATAAAAATTTTTAATTATATIYYYHRHDYHTVQQPWSYVILCVIISVSYYNFSLPVTYFF
jgi:hypothetical protein